MDPGRHRRHEGRAGCAACRRCAAPSAGTAPGLAGRAHRVRHRVPRPPRGRLARRHPGHPATTPSGRRPDGRARWRPGVLRRRPGGLRSGPPPERAGEPAARRSRAAAGLRLGGRGGCPARGRRHGRGHRARRDLRGRQRDADECVRAQPRDAAGAGARRRLLAAHDQPLPRGARASRRTGPRRGSRARDGRDGRSSRVLLGLDRPARPAGTRAVPVHDPALGRHRRCDRRGARGRRRTDAPAGRPGHRRHPHRPPGRASRDGHARQRRGVVEARAGRHAPAGRCPGPDPRPDPAPRIAVPPRALQRPGRVDPAGQRPVACGL